MIVDFCQRWRAGRESYRPAREPFDPRLFEVETIEDDTTAKAFVVRQHYSGTFPAALRRYGLREHATGELVGVVVASRPANDATLSVLGCPADDGAEIGRIVLLDRIGANAETWLLAEVFRRLAREGYAGLISFSDPVPRAAEDGRLVHVGHVGTIYQASNGVFLGRSKPGLLRLLPDGRIMSPRAIAKIRRRDRGWRYASSVLEQLGAAPLGEREDAGLWLERWLPVLTRTVRHEGNLKYAFGLHRAVRRGLLKKARPYPKLVLRDGGPVLLGG